MDGVLFTTSWDDGCPEDLRMAELLSERGLTGTFYASTGPSGRRLISDADLESIAGHHELGNHGRTHRLFTDLEPQEILDEVAWAKADIGRFGADGVVVAPPKGRTNGRVNRLLVREGFVVRTAPVLAATRVGDGVLEPSFQFFPHRSAALIRNTLRRHIIPAAPLLVTWTRRRGFAERMRGLVAAAAAHSGYVHIWGHSAEVQRLSLWDALDDLLASASAVGVRPVTNGEASRILGRTALL